MTTAKDNALGIYLTGIRDGRPHEAMQNYTGERYTQHSTGVGDGKEGFIAFFEPFLERNPKRDIQVLRALQDGRHVFVHVFQSLNDGEAQWVTTDFFDSDDEGKIIEHWDVIGEYNPSNLSGHSNIDGATEITDLDKTEANKALVREFMDVCLIGNDASKLGGYISAESYIDHSPNAPDGLEHFKSLWAAPNYPLSYQECFLMVGEGNFVATLNRARLGEEDLCQTDLFRLENGKIVEHWDNSEPIPPKEELANSGKF